MNKSEIAEKAAREIAEFLSQSKSVERKIAEVVERAIAESQAPQPDTIVNR